MSNLWGPVQPFAEYLEIFTCAGTEVPKRRATRLMRCPSMWKQVRLNGVLMTTEHGEHRFSEALKQRTQQEKQAILLLLQGFKEEGSVLRLSQAVYHGKHQRSNRAFN